MIGILSGLRGAIVLVVENSDRHFADYTKSTHFQEPEALLIVLLISLFTDSHPI